MNQYGHRLIEALKSQDMHNNTRNLVTSDEFKREFPQFAEMVGFNQQNDEHKYDLFDHTLHAVEAAKKLCLEQKLDESLTNKILMTMMCHDLGKLYTKTPKTKKDPVTKEPYQVQGESGPQFSYRGHAGKSAEIAPQILAKMGFAQNEAEEITHYVNVHDEHISLDPNNTKTVDNFINKVGKDLSIYKIISKSDTLAQNHPEEKLVKLEEKLEAVMKEITNQKEIPAQKPQAEQPTVSKEEKRKILDNAIRNMFTYVDPTTKQKVCVIAASQFKESIGKGLLNDKSKPVSRVEVLDFSKGIMEAEMTSITKTEVKSQMLKDTVNGYDKTIANIGKTGSANAVVIINPSMTQELAKHGNPVEQGKVFKSMLQGSSSRIQNFMHAVFPERFHDKGSGPNGH